MHLNEQGELQSPDAAREEEQAVALLWNDERSALWAGIPLEVIRSAAGYQCDAAGGCG